MKKLVALLIILSPAICMAQIAPECRGVSKPADYDEERQRSFMQNYFVSLFMPVPIIESHPSESGGGSIGLDAAYVPRLSCQQRLALEGTKTENTNLSPLLPRIRLKTKLFDFSLFQLLAGITMLPPVPVLKSTVWNLAAEITFSAQLVDYFALHTRAFMGVGYLRAEIALPLQTGDPVKPEWFSFASFGADVSASFRWSFFSINEIYPYLTLGFIKGSSLVVVGDDLVPVPNEKYPLFAPTGFVGVSYKLLDSLLVSVAFGGTMKAAISGHLRVAYAF